MNRRQLIGRVAAIAAAVAVAPAAKVEAAAAPKYSCHGCGGQTYESTLTGVRLRMCDACQRAYEATATWDDVRAARAEGYERGRAVAEARAESRALQDDTAYLQGFLDRGETLPAGTFTINRTLIARGSAIGQPANGTTIRVEFPSD